jgi:spectinomycin phosphotransferase
MRDRPEDFDERDLVRVLADGWLIEPVIMEYAPVGFGDYHWTAVGADDRRWFVKVADLDHKTHCGPDAAAALIGLERAMDTAADLALRPELDFVAGPVRGVDGRTVRPVGCRYAVSVFPRLDAEPGTFDRKRTAAERADVIDLLVRLHSARPPAPTPLQPIDLTLRAVVLEAIAPPVPEPVEGQAPAQSAPFRSASRDLITTHRDALRRRLAEFDTVAATIPTSPEELVITHGEPHPGNLLRDHGPAGAGGYHLIDWDTVGLAVPERDLAGIDAGPEDLERYEAATGHRPDPRLITAYHLRWDLEELGIYADQFRNDHDRSPDTELAWQGLVESVRRLATDGHD